MPLRFKVSDGQLRELVQRLLRNSRSSADIPVIITDANEGKSATSTGRVLDRRGGRVRVLVDTALDCDSAITAFLPEHAYLAEVVSCVAAGNKYTVELVLIQYRSK
jgi:hypothetical protein